MSSTIRLSSIYQRTGRFEVCDHEWTLRPTVFGASKYALILFWQKSVFPYLSLALRTGTVDASSGMSGFRELAGDADLKLPEAWRNLILEPGSEVLSLKLSADSKLHATVEINTDHRVFCDHAEQVTRSQAHLGADKQGMLIQLQGYLMAGDHNEKVELSIAIQPAMPVPVDEGFVGLDLGNFNSTLAALAPGCREPKEIKIVRELRASDRRPELASDAPAIMSPVFLRAVEDGQVSDAPDAIRWEIGLPTLEAAAESMDGVELAPKRLVASPDYQRQKMYRVFDRPSGTGAQKINIEIPRRVPGELLACRMFQMFREATRRRPGKIALSYPTTYSDRELAQLREVVHRAKLRMQPRPQTPETLAPLRIQDAGPAELVNLEEGICLMLDEASAAAFFFLYDRIITAPGQLSRFRYLYPQGLNLLLYDCGGGTTDIALVRALVRESQPRQLVLTVRGRVGCRDFGGDYITEAVYRLLKVKAAQKLATGRLPNPPGGDGLSVKALDAYYHSHGDEIDQLIPTTYSRERFDANSRKRQERAIQLWNLAERVKQELSKPANRGRYTIPDSDWYPLGITKEQRGLLQGLTLTDKEVNTLVRERAERTVAICNELIRLKLVKKHNTGFQEEHSEPEEVHWVVAAGTACRYPLIPEVLKSKLHVPFIGVEDQAFSQLRFKLDVDNLKHSVAKGLVLALMAKYTELGFRLEFDSQLSQRLPFEIAYRDAAGEDRILFRENAHVETMRDRREVVPGMLDQAAGPIEGVAQDVILYRRFPGERDYSAYLRYRFHQGVQGRLTVRYDHDAVPPGSGMCPFVMTNEVTYEDGDCTELVPEDVYYHPVQRGDL